MAESSEISLLTLIDRLAKLEGLLLGLQNSIVQSQSQVTSFMSRVERLEQRQIELEKGQVTRDDMRELSEKVDGLIASDARQRGGLGMAGWSLSQAINLAAVLIALLALVGVGLNRDRLTNLQQEQQLQQDLTR
jgi:hypothetical protein